MRTPVLLPAALLLLPLVAHAADLVELRRTLPPGDSGTVALIVNRDAVTAMRVDQGKGPAVTIEVTLDAEAKQRFPIRCVDIGAARQVVDVLSARNGAPLLDVSGRCSF